MASGASRRPYGSLPTSRPGVTGPERGVAGVLFSVRLVSRQPADLDAEAWQGVVAQQLAATKALRDEGKIKAIYRETGSGVLAIFDVTDAAEMDQILAGLPMGRYFSSVSANAIWDMGPALENA
ncbi:MAG: hypothetical protein F4Y54_01745 [Dehalococcoidia bacterium]|nr:hypothetical protein [Dehalococcoidia bacterium]